MSIIDDVFAKVYLESRKELRLVIENMIDSKIQEEQERIAEHEEVKAILEPLEGKQMDGRTINKTRLGEKFKYVAQRHQHEIVGKYRHTIHNSFFKPPVISIESFEEHDACNGRAARERVEKLQDVDMDEALDVYMDIKEFWQGLKKAFAEAEKQKLTSFHFPIHYSILDHIQGEISNYDPDLKKF